MNTININPPVYSFREAINTMLDGYKITPLDENGPLDGYFEFDSTHRAVYWVDGETNCSVYSRMIWKHVNDIFVIK